MWRWPKRILLVLCAAVALAAAFVQWRSHRINSIGHWYGEKSWVGVYCSRGRLVVGIGREHIQAVVKHDYYERPVKPRADEVQFDEGYHGGQWIGIGYYQSNNPTVAYLLLPLWVIWAFPSVPIAISLSKRLKGRVRQTANRCVNCGYDLRGGSDRCPECGWEDSARVGLAPPL